MPSRFRAFMAELRAKSGKSVRDIAAASGVCSSSVHRSEKEGGASVFGHTLVQILTQGYGLEKDSPVYRKAIVLWTEEKTTQEARPRSNGLAKKIDQLSPEQVDALRRLIANPSLLTAAAKRKAKG